MAISDVSSYTHSISSTYNSAIDTDVTFMDRPTIRLGDISQFGYLSIDTGFPKPVGTNWQDTSELCIDFRIRLLKRTVDEVTEPQPLEDGKVYNIYYYGTWGEPGGCVAACEDLTYEEVALWGSPSTDTGANLKSYYGLTHYPSLGDCDCYEDEWMCSCNIMAVGQEYVVPYTSFELFTIQTNTSRRISANYSVTDSQIYFFYRDNNGSTIIHVTASSITLTPETWYHLAFVLHVPDHMSIWVDGVRKAVTTTPTISVQKLSPAFDTTNTHIYIYGNAHYSMYRISLGDDRITNPNDPLYSSDGENFTVPEREYGVSELPCKETSSEEEPGVQEIQANKYYCISVASYIQQADCASITYEYVVANGWPMGCTIGSDIISWYGITDCPGVGECVNCWDYGWEGEEMWLCDVAAVTSGPYDATDECPCSF